jgi:hypothetical protein
MEADSKLNKICCIENCGKPKTAKNRCQYHYDILRKTPERLSKAKISAKAHKLRESQKRIESAEFNERCQIRDVNYRSKYRNLRREKYLENNRGYHKKPKRRYGQAKHRASKRGIEFTLTSDEYAYLTQKNMPCHYDCGSTIPESGVGLDRLDSEKGYTLENSVPCCEYCNVLKNSYASSNEMIEIVKLLKTLRNNQDIWKNTKNNRALGKERRSQ